MQEVHRQVCGMNDRKTEATQGLLLWAQSPTLMMVLPNSSLSHPCVPHPSVYLGSSGLDLEYTLLPGFQSQFLLFTGGSGTQGAGLEPTPLIPSLGSPHCPFE